MWLWRTCFPDYLKTRRGVLEAACNRMRQRVHDQEVTERCACIQFSRVFARAQQRSDFTPATIAHLVRLEADCTRAGQRLMHLRTLSVVFERMRDGADDALTMRALQSEMSKLMAGMPAASPGAERRRSVVWTRQSERFRLHLEQQASRASDVSEFCASLDLDTIDDEDEVVDDDAAPTRMRERLLRESMPSVSTRTSSPNGGGGGDVRYVSV